MANASVDLNIPETVSKGAYGRSNDLEGVERSYVKTNPSGVLIVDLTSKGIWDYAGRTREREWGNSTCRPSTNCRCGVDSRCAGEPRALRWFVGFVGGGGALQEPEQLLRRSKRFTTTIKRHESSAD